MGKGKVCLYPPPAGYSLLFDLLLVDIKAIAVKSGLDVPKHLMVQKSDRQVSSMTHRDIPVE
jgi:hypothetical protein